ncbi:receptor-type tyrosine-protein phosphatase alpha-like [Saccostrea cucullata]|uniref:receptor-type tyrosine-protein phosphatase alpha-like n=1 Tax=Saccostrea cuccullata TaxID=36930 RepID=UPI002ED4C3AC
MRLRRRIHKETSRASVSIQMSPVASQKQQAEALPSKKRKEQNNHQLHNVEEKAKRGPPTNKTVLTRNLQAIIAKMSAAENAGFKHEYHEIPRGELFPCDEAKKPENKPKNRYTTTFPYNHSRAVLKTNSPNENDYINANYIEDTQSNRKYIATQGPKPKTVVDFWRMIWQECVNTIVCLTNLKEGTKIKCTQYWPNLNDKMQHGNFIIRNLGEKVYANYTSRRFKVYNNMERKDREVLMFHYTRWPDHGVPDPLNLVVFHRHVMKTSPQTGKYTLVHCSAGIGRTGTYIALDALYREGERNGRVNVPMYVRTMRKDRMNMIQGEDQYKVIYLALCESFSGRSRCLTAEKLSQGENCYSSCGEATNSNPLASEFQSLQSLQIKYTEKDYEPGQTNISANYTESVLPVEKFMCYLSYTKGRNNYYNAVLLQSFTENDSLISAQYPLPDFTEDFLRLIRDFDARVVVFLGPLKEIKSSSLWVPTKSENKILGSFVLNLATSTNSVNFTTRNIVLQPRGSSDIKMKVMECKTWKEGRFLTDKRVLLDVVKEAKAEKDKEEGKILVLSSDGATRCGAFCVVYNALEQLSMDQEADIFTITRQLQIRRPEFVSTLEEYQLCYDVVSEYMQNDSVYANC